jgi:predicted amidohydrolase
MFLAMEEHGGDEDLCGSDRRSVIPYVHGRIGVLYCCELNFPEIV